MNVLTIGTGEAFDPDIPNNSHLVSAEKVNILLDCGYSVPQQWFRLGKGGNFLDAIYISHKHADHYFGLPILMMWMWRQRRTKPLAVICQKELVGFFSALIDGAYRDFRKQFKYRLDFIGVQAGKTESFYGLGLSFAPTIHSIENLAIRIEDGKHVMCYSGDGQFVKETIGLYQNADLLIQETFLYDEKCNGHACIKDTIEMAENVQVRRLALTHMEHNFRKKGLAALHLDRKLSSATVEVSAPIPLTQYNL